MADSGIIVSPGTGALKVDTRTESTNLDHRQVVVIGDPSTNVGVAPVDATNGLMVTLSNASAGIIATGSQAGPSTAYLSTISAGDLAHDAPDTGNPVKQGGVAAAGLSTVSLTSANDRTNLYGGRDGALIVRPHCGLEDIVSARVTDTTGNSTQCLPSAGVGMKTYLTSIILCNTSLNALTVDILDGATIKATLPLPAGSGCIYNPPIPIPGTAATAWNFDPSVAATTVTCTMVGFKSKV